MATHRLGTEYERAGGIEQRTRPEPIKAEEALEILSRLSDMIADRVVERLARPSDTRLLSTSDAARETGQSIGAIRAAVAGGELAHVRVGRVFRFLKSDLDAWIKRNRVA